MAAAQPMVGAWGGRRLRQPYFHAPRSTPGTVTVGASGGVSFWRAACVRVAFGDIRIAIAETRCIPTKESNNGNHGT